MGFILDWLAIRRHRRERQLFKFWDGTRLRYADPMHVMGVLAAHPKFDPNVHPYMLGVEDAKASVNAKEICLQAMCDAFSVQRFDGQRGMTDLELLGLMGEFEKYLGTLKKNTSPPQIWPVSTEPESSGKLTMKQESDCISTGNESKPGELGA